MSNLLSNLRQVGGNAEPGTSKAAWAQNPPTKALVFVHGIFSSHATFDALIEGLIDLDPDINAWGRFYFDYYFHQSIAFSGRQLAEYLNNAFPGPRKPEVTLVCHSMGGLVGRAALLQVGDLGMIKRIVMLGTPNHGTLHTAQLGLLAHWTREKTGELWPVIMKKGPGLKELTEINRTFAPMIEAGKLGTKRVEYVTIPGLFYHEESNVLSTPTGTDDVLRRLNLLFALLSMFPGAKVRLQIPHDGIVEESSVRLSGTAASFSERPATTLGLPAFGPYLHLSHADYRKIDHVHVQEANRTVRLLADLLRQPSLSAWTSSLADTGEYNLYSC